MLRMRALSDDLRTKGIPLGVLYSGGQVNILISDCRKFPTAARERAFALERRHCCKCPFVGKFVVKPASDTNEENFRGF